MKLISKTTHHLMFKPVSEGSKHFYTRIWNDILKFKLENYKPIWIVAHENQLGLVSTTGPCLEEDSDLYHKLESEYQSTQREDFIDKVAEMMTNLEN